MQTLWRDLRYALRMLEKSSGFSAVAVLTLALGIGANTAIFQLLDAVRLRTLPVKNPEQIAKIDHRNGAALRRGTTPWSPYGTNDSVPPGQKPGCRLRMQTAASVS